VVIDAVFASECDQKQPMMVRLELTELGLRRYSLWLWPIVVFVIISGLDYRGQYMNGMVYIDGIQGTSNSDQHSCSGQKRLWTNWRFKYNSVRRAIPF